MCQDQGAGPEAGPEVEEGAPQGGTGQGQGADQEEGVDHDPEGEGVTDPEVDHPEEVSRQMATGSILEVRVMSIKDKCLNNNSKKCSLNDALKVE